MNIKELYLNSYIKGNGLSKKEALAPLRILPAVRKARLEKAIKYILGNDPELSRSRAIHQAFNVLRRNKYLRNLKAQYGLQVPLQKGEGLLYKGFGGAANLPIDQDLTNPYVLADNVRHFTHLPQVAGGYSNIGKVYRLSPELYAETRRTAIPHLRGNFDIQDALSGKLRKDVLNGNIDPYEHCIAFGSNLNRSNNFQVLLPNRKYSQFMNDPSRVYNARFSQRVPFPLREDTPYSVIRDVEKQKFFRDLPAFTQFGIVQ